MCNYALKFEFKNGYRVKCDGGLRNLEKNLQEGTNVTLRRIGETTLAVEKQQIYGVSFMFIGTCIILIVE